MGCQKFHNGYVPKNTEATINTMFNENPPTPPHHHQDCFCRDIMSQHNHLAHIASQAKICDCAGFQKLLDQQQKERDDTTSHRSCMFCIEEFTGNRWPTTKYIYLNYIYIYTNTYLLQQKYVNEFLDTLKWKLENMQCLYCEKTFRDKTTLKYHMRIKRQKLRLRSMKSLCWAVVMLQELGKTWEEVQSEDDRELFEDEDDHIFNWQAHPVCAVCLFCEEQAEAMEKVYTHMEETHEFDLHKLKTDLSDTDSYTVKKKIIKNIMCCFFRYYVPTYENDALLTALSDSESESEGPNPSSEVPVIAEDISNLKVIKQTSVLNKLLKDRGSSD
uniref:Zinc finger protein 277 n=1 Tax=Cyprinus carpio TaxID=7962 RepID=A0A8C2KNH1_CYPCA